MFYDNYLQGKRPNLEHKTRARCKRSPEEAWKHWRRRNLRRKFRGKWKTPASNQDGSTWNAFWSEYTLTLLVRWQKAFLERCIAYNSSKKWCDPELKSPSPRWNWYPKSKGKLNQRSFMYKMTEQTSTIPKPFRNYFDKRTSPTRSPSNSANNQMEWPRDWTQLSVTTFAISSSVLKALACRCRICCLCVQQSDTFFPPRRLPKRSLWRSIWPLQDSLCSTTPRTAEKTRRTLKQGTVRGDRSRRVQDICCLKSWNRESRRWKLSGANGSTSCWHRKTWRRRHVFCSSFRSQIYGPAPSLRNGGNHCENPTIPRAWPSCLSYWSRRTTWRKEFCGRFSIRSVDALNEASLGNKNT